MIRRAATALVVASALAALVWTLYFLYTKSRKEPPAYETAQPVITDIVQKTVAPGALVPRNQIDIKPRVSGIVEKLFVEPGARVKKNEAIAEIRIVPNVVNLNAAEASLESARISFASAEQELARYQQLLSQNVVSETEFNRIKLDHALRKQELEAARRNLELVRVGATKKSGLASNVVVSTVDGTIIDVPIKEGASVIETNNFNEGSTIATVADMNDMIFQGNVDESDVGKIKQGMPVDITIGALKNQKFSGSLEYVAPKGVDKEGTIEFEVRASVELKEGVFIRANYSANASIILDRRRQVLALDESLLQFDGDKPFVEVEVGPGRFERRPVKLGLSDGITVEVLGGLKQGDKVKKPQGAES